MKILHLVGTLNYGGIERLVTDLAIRQKIAGHAPSVCCLLRKEGGLIPVIESEGIPVQESSYSDKAPWQLAVRLARQIKDQNYDIIHSHVNFSLLWQVVGFLKFGRIPFIITQHTLLKMSLRKRLRSIIIYRLIKPFIKKHVAVSMYAANYAAYIYAINPDKIRVIYNGILANRYGFDETTRTLFREKWEIPRDAILLGSVGRLDWVKGYDVLLKAFARARKRQGNLYLVFAGEGTLEEELRDLARSCQCDGFIRMIGKTSNVRAVLSSCDLYIQPSRMEALGLSILEALSNGLLTIATDVGGIKEIRQHSDNIFLVPPENEDVLADAILRQSERIGKQGNRTSKLPEIFSFNAMFAAYESCYHEALES